ncbi:MAG: HWE histidine kinase domain-containing protein [Pseudomonadota bacterium]
MIDTFTISVTATAGMVLGILGLASFAMNANGALPVVSSGSIGTTMVGVLAGLYIGLVSWSPLAVGDAEASSTLMTIATVLFVVATTILLIGSVHALWRARGLPTLSLFRRDTVDRLKTQNIELHRQVDVGTEQLHELKRRFHVALKDSRITVAMLDTHLRYVWLHNPPDGFDVSEMIGKRDDEIYDGSAGREALLAKKQVIATGQEIETEIEISPREPSQQKRYFNLTIEPYYANSGQLHGLLSVSVETTEERQREQRLRDTLLEVSHRTKNQLAMLAGLGRQLQKKYPDAKPYADALSERIRVMSACQDALVANDWSAVDLDALLLNVLAPYAPNFTSACASTPPIAIVPGSVQTLGMAMLELFAAAADHDGRGTKLSPNVTWVLESQQQTHKTTTRQLVISVNWPSGVSQKATQVDTPELDRVTKQLVNSALSGTVEWRVTDEAFGFRLTVPSEHLV